MFGRTVATNTLREPSATKMLTQYPFYPTSISIMYQYQYQLSISIWLLQVRTLQTSIHFAKKNYKSFNILRPRQNGRHFPDDSFKLILLNENVWISIEVSLKFVPKGPINNIPALVQIMAWRRPGDKPLSEPMMVSSLTHICVTRPQWVNH